jgi:hypothetical protein
MSLVPVFVIAHPVRDRDRHRTSAVSPSSFGRRVAIRTASIWAGPRV